MNLLTRLATGLLLCAAAALPGRASIVRDLGLGLTYYRVHELPTDQPSPRSGRPGACVVDLRYAKSDERSAAALRAWLRFNATPHAPIFVLENAQTDPALLAALPGNEQLGLMVLAPASARIGPDFPVRVSEQLDRRAYEALEKGADIATLLSDYPDKPRIDEAYLEKEHLADSDAPDVDTDKPAPPRPLVDPLLQRAVQLHRGLLALKKL